MHRVVLACCLATVALAEPPVVQLEVVDPVAGQPSQPQRSQLEFEQTDFRERVLWGFDVHLVDLGDAPQWGASGIMCRTFGEDANRAEVVYPGFWDVFVPDEDGGELTDRERFTTFLSLPRNRDALVRFRERGAPPYGGPLWGYLAPTGEASPDYFDSAWWPAPDTPGIDRPGYIARLMLNLKKTGFTARDVYLVQGYHRIRFNPPTTPMFPPRFEHDVPIALGVTSTVTVTATDALDAVGWVAYGADCDGNGIPDSIDLREGRQEDCRGDGLPDGCQSACALADLTGDNVVDLNDLALLLAAFGESAAGDVDCDGGTGLTDLASVLAAYEAGVPV